MPKAPLSDGILQVDLNHLRFLQILKKPHNNKGRGSPDCTTQLPVGYPFRWRLSKLWEILIVHGKSMPGNIFWIHLYMVFNFLHWSLLQLSGRSLILHRQMCKHGLGKSKLRTVSVWHVTNKFFSSASLGNTDSVLQIHWSYQPLQTLFY